MTFFQRPESAFLQERQLEKLDLLGVFFVTEKHGRLRRREDATPLSPADANSHGLSVAATTNSDEYRILSVTAQ